MSYRELAPAAPLAPWIECYWRIRVDHPVAPAPRALLPDGCMDILFSFADPPRDVAAGTTPPRFVVGTMTRPHHVANGRRTDLLGVRFRAAAAPAFLGVPAAELTDGSAELEAVWGAAAAELWDRLAEQPDDAARARVLDAALGARLGDARARVDRSVAWACRLLERSDWRGDARALAGQVGVGRRQLERRFQASVGVSPVVFRRVVRARRAVEALREAPAGSLASIAVAAGYYDQPHLTRELRALTGRTPRAWQRDASVQERRPHER